MFPYHTVPDGCWACPHHYISALFVLVLIVAKLWDNRRRREPWIMMGGVMLSWFGWAFLWPRPGWEVFGAVATMLGLGIASWMVLSGLLTLTLERLISLWRDSGFQFERSSRSWGLLVWDDYDWKWGAAAALLLLVAWDDVLQHAFGWPTPLDVWYKTGGSDLFDRVQEMLRNP